MEQQLYRRANPCGPDARVGRDHRRSDRGIAAAPGAGDRLWHSALLLLRVAPGCERYVGTDFSPQALGAVRQEVERLGLGQVALLQRPADDFGGLADEAFDCVILNSVVQYFPDIDYLLRVLAGAAQVLAPGGAIFVGDVRSYPLMEAFHTAVQLFQAPDELPIAALRQRVQKQLAQEHELLVDPAFFAALRGYVPQISQTQTMLKRGRHLNELTKFRYDVVLRIAPTPQPEPAWLDWRRRELTAPAIRELLIETQPAALGIARVPNARVLADARAIALLGAEEPPASAGELRAALEELPTIGLEPEELWALGDQLPYIVEIQCPAGGTGAEFDVVFRRQDLEIGDWRLEIGDFAFDNLQPFDFAQDRSPISNLSYTADSRPLAAYANDPLRGSMFRSLVPELRELLQSKLPDYMVPSAFVLLDRLPLAPSGKLDRSALPAPDTARPDLGTALVAPRTPPETALAAIWCQILGLDQVGVHDNFFAVGGDSILCIQVVARARQAGLHLTPKQVFQHQTIAELAAVTSATPSIDAAQGPISGPLPLTPIMRWFFAQEQPEPQHFNQALLLETRQALDPALLEQAFQTLLAHHDMLRLRFANETGWQAVIAVPQPQPICEHVDLSALAGDAQTAALETWAAAIHASLDLAAGPLVRAALFDLGAGRPGRLLLVIHHLAVDGVSWRILLDDLELLCRQVVQARSEIGDWRLRAIQSPISNLQSPTISNLQLPPKTTPFPRWAERLHAHAQSAALRGELAYWLGLPWAQVAALPIDAPAQAEAYTFGAARSLSTELDAEETAALLHEVPAAYHTQVTEVLLTALLQTFAAWTDTPALLIDLEGHGREPLFDDVDLSRTVGWYTTIFPVLLEGNLADGPGALLRAVKEQVRRVPNHGIGYGLLRYLSEDPDVAARLRALPQAEVSFNYLGQLDQVLATDALLAPAQESSGPAQSPRNRRRYLIDIGGLVAGGRFQVQWTYSPRHAPASVERLAAGFMAALRELIAHCRQPETGAYTPSDFPLAGLSQQQLDSVLAAVSNT